MLKGRASIGFKRLSVLIFALGLVLSGCSQKTDSTVTETSTSQPMQVVGENGEILQPEELWYGEVVEDKSLLTDKELGDIAVVTRYQPVYDYEAAKFKGMDYFNKKNSVPFEWDYWMDNQEAVMVTAVVTNDNTKVELFQAEGVQDGTYTLGPKIGENILNRWESFSVYGTVENDTTGQVIRITSEKGNEVVVPLYQQDAQGSNTVDNNTMYLYPYDKNNTKYKDKELELSDNVMTIAWEKDKQAHGIYLTDRTKNQLSDQGTPIQQIITDLDSDGKDEDIYLASGTFGDAGDFSMGEFTVNGEAATFVDQLPAEKVVDGESYQYYPVGIDVIDIDPFDGKKELVLYREIMAYEDMVSYFHYDAGTWTHLGDTEAVYTNQFLWYGSINQEKRELTVNQLSQYFCTSYYNRYYKLENEKIVPIRVTEEVSLLLEDQEITGRIIGEFNLYKDPEGKELLQVVSPDTGRNVTLMSTNLKTWVKVKIDSYQVGYMLYEPYMSQEYGIEMHQLKDQEGLQPYDVIEGLPYAG